MGAKIIYIRAPPVFFINGLAVLARADLAAVSTSEVAGEFVEARLQAALLTLHCRKVTRRFLRQNNNLKRGYTK